MERHPFDVEIIRIEPGKAAYPYQLHSAQWEFYHVIAGTSAVRHRDGSTPIGPGFGARATRPVPVAEQHVLGDCLRAP